MKKRMFAGALALLVLLSGCGQSAPKETGALQLVCTTYPVYLLTTAVIEGADGVQANLMVDEPVSCLHDYTLTVDDMKLLETADLIAMNGVGLEAFMDDALKTSQAELLDCSAGVPLLKRADGSDDPHIWMDPKNAQIMTENIARALAALDPNGASIYEKNAAAAVQRLDEAFATNLKPMPKGVKLITFHDGFEYFAQAFSCPILKAIEEEEGAETSAREMAEIVEAVKANNLPAIFTEENGPTATADAICRETGAKACSLSMLMSGSDRGLEAYISVLQDNYSRIVEAFT
ncbi:MAG: metal ABC transporter substrate-binding protein [Pseudoflavonifractor sp.]